MTIVVWPVVVVVDRWAIDDCSIHAIAVDLVVAVGLPNESVVGMIVGMMGPADAMAAAFGHGIADSWCNADDGSDVDLLGRPRATPMLMRMICPSDAMGLGLVSAVVHGISGRWAVGNSECAFPMRSVDLVAQKRF